jgi:transcriptional regulator with XRE-family HTH domain
MDSAASPLYIWGQARERASHLGYRVRTKRADLDWSQPHLIDELDPDAQIKDFTVPNLSRIERGDMIPSFAIALLLSDWLLQDPSQSACPSCGQEYQ